AVVDRIERPEAAGARPDPLESDLVFTDPAAEGGGRHRRGLLSFARHPSEPWLGRAWHHTPRAGCRGFTGPVPSASLDVERDSPAPRPTVPEAAAPGAGRRDNTACRFLGSGRS